MTTLDKQPHNRTKRATGMYNWGLYHSTSLYKSRRSYQNAPSLQPVSSLWSQLLI